MRISKIINYPKIVCKVISKWGNVETIKVYIWADYVIWDLFPKNPCEYNSIFGSLSSGDLLWMSYTSLSPQEWVIGI